MTTKDEILAMLTEEDPPRLRALFELADQYREFAVGDEVHLRGLIEISNHCARNCLYCGLRRGNRKLERYRMTDGEILDTAAKAAARGRKTIILQSGEDPELTSGRIAALVEKIKREMDVAVTLSLGEYSRDDFFRMRDAGADRYLLKHETIDPEIYRKMHPGMSHERRIRRLVWLKEAGFQTGSGIIVGLPGQTVESIAGDIVFMARLEVDMAGIGPFIPHPDTPLAGHPSGSSRLTLKAIAAARVAMPLVHIPATTALATASPEGRRTAMRCGANVIMPDITPEKYRRLYEIYPNRAWCAEEKAEDLILSLGREVAADYGHSRREDHFRRLAYCRLHQKILSAPG